MTRTEWLESDHVTRRAVLGLATASLVGMATACEHGVNDGPPPPEPVSADAAEQAVADASALLDAVRTALNAEFGDLGWAQPEAGEQMMSADEDGNCLYRTELLHSDVYLGVEVGTPEQMATVLNAVFTEHGFEQVEAPEGSTGGWLSMETTNGALGFALHSKGYTEMSASVLLEGPGCTLPST